MDLLHLRAGFVLCCVAFAALLVWKHASALRVLKQFFLEPAAPVNLGILRAVLFGMLFWAAADSAAEWFASLPSTFKRAPRGWDWLRDYYPFSPLVTRALKHLLLVSSLLAMVGFLTQLTMPVAALTAVLVLGVENFYFKINHGLHVPVLSALVIAASRAGDAFSVDSLVRRIRRRPPPGPHLEYTLPIRFCWLLAGTMYLFPGLWKLWETGDLWLDGTKMRVELFDKWGQMPEFLPPLNTEQLEPIAVLLGTATLVLELGFLFCVFHPVARVVAALSAVAFHVGVGLLMNIWFIPIHPLILLLDYPRVLPARVRTAVSHAGANLLTILRARMPGVAAARLTEPGSPSSDPPASPNVTAAPLPATREVARAAYWAVASSLVGSVLVSGMFVAGIAPIDSWPIAVYPRFATRVARPRETSTALRFVRKSTKGEERLLPGPMAPLGDAELFRVIQAALSHKAQYGEFPRAHLDLLARLVRRNHPSMESGDSLLVYQYQFPVDPNARRRWRPQFELVAQTPLTP